MARLITLLVCVLVGAVVQAAEPLVIYSAQKEPSLRPLLDRYTAQTGVEVQLLVDQGPVLVERMAAEGDNTRADLLLTVDAGNLWQAAQRGLLAKLDSELLQARVPSNLRDADDRWFAISRRVRGIVYSTARVKPEQLSTYAALAEAQWKGRLCLRTSKNVYNQSLVAMRIASMGEAPAEAMVRGWIANLATAPLSDDTLTAQAIAGGECDVGLVNMYYVARLKRAQPDLPVTMFWPDQAADGAHQNICGAGVARHARNPAGAQALLEWLTEVDTQREISKLNLEFPVNAEAPADPLLIAFGPLKSDATDLSEAGRLQPEAVRLMDRAGWR
jgi:iron(III) transport system substrate-binding protein